MSRRSASSTGVSPETAATTTGAAPQFRCRAHDRHRTAVGGARLVSCWHVRRRRPDKRHARRDRVPRRLPRPGVPHGNDRLAAHGDIELRDAVMVVSNADGRVIVRETRDLQTSTSAASGAIWAGLFGLILGGPVGWIAGTAVGAAGGAITAKVVDHGIPGRMGRLVPPGGPSGGVDRRHPRRRRQARSRVRRAQALRGSPSRLCQRAPGVAGTDPRRARRAAARHARSRRPASHFPRPTLGQQLTRRAPRIGEPPDPGGSSPVWDLRPYRMSCKTA